MKFINPFSTRRLFPFSWLLLLGWLTTGCQEQGTVPQAKVAATNLAPTARVAASSVSLTNDQRRAYLRYYAPVIFKQASESEAVHYGHDWITNFYFDNDVTLSNNKQNWSKELGNFVNYGQHPDWKIRPTLYTSLIEFYDHSRGTKSVILLYHIYHAKQRYSIHDWERVEIRIDGVQGNPNSGETINYVVITRHSLHNSREYPHEDLNFMETPNGKHVMIWQADWELGLIGQAELHFVEDSWSTVNSLKQNNGSAKVDINDSGRNTFHYLFVNDSDPQAVSYWNAQAITPANARSLAAAQSEGTTVSMASVKKITYELQDIADILPTHLSPVDWTKTKQVALTDPVLSETGQVEIPAGTHTFYYESLDTEDSEEDRDGFIRKHWFWGVYYYNADKNAFYDQLDPEPWAQHYYFAHNGTRGDATLNDELTNRGIFLGKGLYANWTLEGGFDGRWVQLFPD